MDRIFIVKDDQLQKFLALSEVSIHFEGAEPKNLCGYFIEYEKLQRRDASLLGAVGHGFIDFDGKVALIDNFSDTGEVRGRVTKKPAELKKIRELFGKLKNMAEEMNGSGLDAVRQRLIPSNAPKMLGVSRETVNKS